MVLYRLRIAIAGELAGSWGASGGLGGQLCILSNHLEARIGENSEVAARVMVEEMFPLARTDARTPSESSGWPRDLIATGGSE